MLIFFFFSSRRRHTRYWRDWSSDVCSSDLLEAMQVELVLFEPERVAGLARRDAVAPEQLPQRRDMTLHHVAGSRRRPRAPERVDGFVHRDHLSRPEQQQRE